MAKKDERLISIGELDAKYGLPLYDTGNSKCERGIYRHIDPEELGFETTEGIESPTGLERLVGQEKPMREILEGLRIQEKGYNIIIRGNGSHDMPLIIRSAIEEYAKTASVKNVDQIAWQNFENPMVPRIAAVPAGYGKFLKAMMTDALTVLAGYVPDPTNAEGFFTGLHELKKQETASKTAYKHMAATSMEANGIPVSETDEGIHFLEHKEKPLALELKAKAEAYLKAFRQRLTEAQKPVQKNMLELIADENFTETLAGFARRKIEAEAIIREKTIEALAKKGIMAEYSGSKMNIKNEKEINDEQRAYSVILISTMQSCQSSILGEIDTERTKFVNNLRNPNAEGIMESAAHNEEKAAADMAMRQEAITYLASIGVKAVIKGSDILIDEKEPTGLDAAKKTDGLNYMKSTLDAIETTTKATEERITKHKEACALQDFVGQVMSIRGQAIKNLELRMGASGEPQESFAPAVSYINEIFSYIANNPSVFLKKKTVFSEENNIEEFLLNVLVDNSEMPEGLIAVTQSDIDPFAIIGAVEPHQTDRKPYHLRISAGNLIKANKGIFAITNGDLSLMPYSTLKFSLLKMMETGMVDIGDVSSYEKGIVANCDANTKIILGVTGDGAYLSRAESNSTLIKHFKKRIQLETSMPTSLENIVNFAKAVKGEIEEKQLPDLTHEAVARFAESLLAIAGKSELPINMALYSDITIRAAVSARESGRDAIGREDIDVAFQHYKEEKNASERWFRKYIGRGKIIVGDSPKVGVTNGLAVLSAEMPFGNHLRIGVTVRPNRQGIGRFVNIDKEAGLSGEMFTKSFMQVSSMLKEIYMDASTQFNFDLEASVSQCDNGIDGSSAGAAMSLACISAIADVPVQPHVFFTGGIDPKSGMVTPVGGINEKVMGVYYTCRDLGIEQAIAVIPEANVEELQLVDAEVHKAIKAGRFRVYAHSHIDQTIEIGTRMKAEDVHRKAKQNLCFMQEQAKKKEE